MKRRSTPRLRGKGITYDTGFFHAGVSTHEPFDPEVVKREMHVIHDDLHCNALRITGGDADRLEIAAIHAASAGLQVWFAPSTCDLTTGELLDFLDDAASRAERLRRQGAEVVDTAFVSTFVSYHLPHRPDPRLDLDMASYGVVKVLEDRPGHSYPDMPWEPKAAFTALADAYSGPRRRKPPRAIW